MALAVCFTLPARAANITFTIHDTSSDTITVTDLALVAYERAFRAMVVEGAFRG